jgi:hypothetical protein
MKELNSPESRYRILGSLGISFGHDHAKPAANGDVLQ